MKGIDGLELSPKKTEYIKFIDNRKNTRTNEIAREFKVDPSTATKIIVELSKTDFISYKPYHGCTLTHKGKEYARFLNRRHGLLVCLLVELGMSKDSACEAVCKFEYFVPKEAVDNICKKLKHPGSSPCGVRISGDRCCCCTGEGD